MLCNEGGLEKGAGKKGENTWIFDFFCYHIGEEMIVWYLCNLSLGYYRAKLPQSELPPFPYQPHQCPPSQLVVMLIVS